MKQRHEIVKVSHSGVELLWEPCCRSPVSYELTGTTPQDLVSMAEYQPTQMLQELFRDRLTVDSP